MGRQVLVRPFEHVQRACWMLLVALSFCTYSCSQDNYECGVRKGDAVASCDGPGEFCLCDSHRCVKPDASCTQSRHAYVFEDAADGDDGCVPVELLKNVVFSNTQAPDKALCPDQVSYPPLCGALAGDAPTVCPGQSICLCGVGQVCAVPADECDSGFRRGTSTACIEPAAGEDITTRPNPSGYCPNSDPTIEDERCGTADSQGNVIDCGDAEYCICSTHKCAKPNAGACPDSGYSYRVISDGATSACVDENQVDEVIEKGLCADSRPARVPCGKPGAAECPAEAQQCVCASGFCATPGQESCSSKLRYVGDGECVADADAAVGVIEKGECAPDCGVRVAGRVQNCPFGSCLCTDAGGQCVVEDIGCTSGRASTATSAECIDLPTSPDFFRTVAAGVECPSAHELEPCGSAGRDGRLQACGDDQVCVCGVGGGCATADERCESALAYVDAGGAFIACVSTGFTTVANGDRCDSAQPEPVVCGTPDALGRVASCAAEEHCACTPDAPRASGMTRNGGLCVREQPLCVSGFAGVHDGSCIGYSTEKYLVILDGARVCPGSLQPKVSCAAADGADCGSASSSCRCVGGEHTCVEEVEGCEETGLLFTRQGRCVAADVVVTPFETGACQPEEPAEP